MEDTRYNQQIADEVRSINEKYINRQNDDGASIDEKQLSGGAKRKLFNQGVDRLAAKYGAGFWSDFADGFTSVMKFVPSLLGVGKRGGISTGGGFIDDLFPVISMLGGISTGGAHMDKLYGGAWYDDVLSIAKSVIPLFGLSKKKRGGIQTGGIQTGGIQTGGAWYDDALSIGKSLLPLLALGKKKRGGIQTGGISTGGISTGGISTGGYGLRARAIGGNNDALYEELAEGGRRKMALKKKVRKGKGIDSDDDNVGGKKPNKWITHVKKYARDHNIGYNQAIKEARQSYKK